MATLERLAQPLPRLRRHQPHTASKVGFILWSRALGLIEKNALGLEIRNAASRLCDHQLTLPTDFWIASEEPGLIIARLQENLQPPNVILSGWRPTWEKTRTCCSRWPGRLEVTCRPHSRQAKAVRGADHGLIIAATAALLGDEARAHRGCVRHLRSAHACCAAPSREYELRFGCDGRFRAARRSCRRARRRPRVDCAAASLRGGTRAFRPACVRRCSLDG
jgi:hypothetical protein